MTESNEVAIKTLAAFLKAEIPELEVITEWPDPKHQMKMPTLSIITKGTPRLQNGMPIIISKSDLDPVDPLRKKVAYCIGHYDHELQLDLWTDYKAKRSEFYERIMAAFDKQFIDAGSPTGISLALLDYNNCFARYDQTGYTYMDSAESSQREEWRVKIDVLANYPRVVEKTESIMAEITLKNKIDENEVTDKPTDETLVIP